MNNAEVLHFQDYAGSRVNPQVEDGHVKIANDLFEQIMLFPFTKQQLKVVLAVIRKTYGFQKKVDDISLSQLCELTKLHKPDVSVALKQLAAMNVLKVTDGKYAKRIEFNKHYDHWKEQTVSDSLTRERITNKGLVKHEPQKTIPKANKNTSTSKNKFSDADMTAAQWIFAQIRKVKPDAKAPNLKSWANTIRLLVEVDGHTHKQICELFQWANKHPFWFKNILCPDTLRKQWDKLDIERQGKPLPTQRKRGVVL